MDTSLLILELPGSSQETINLLNLFALHSEPTCTLKCGGVVNDMEETLL